MKTFRAKFNPDAKNVYGVSLVENPAMEGDFIQFSKQKLQFADVDKDKRRVMGLILEPNKLVYRNQNGNEFNIVFTEQDIEDVAYNFQKQSNQKTSTIEHSDSNIEGVTFVETWLVENPQVDKSTNFGFSYPKGSWIGVMQIDNDDVWNDYVKMGKVKGFSIDAFMQLEEVNLNTINMSEIKEDNLVTKIVEGVSVALKNVFSPEKAEEKEEVAEVELAKEDTKEIEVELKEEKEDVKVEFNKADFITDLVKEFEAFLNPLKEENVALKDQLKEVETKLSKQAETLVELSKAPATKSIKKAPSQVNYKDMTNLQKMEYNLQNKK